MKGAEISKRRFGVMAMGWRPRWKKKEPSKVLFILRHMTSNSLTDKPRDESSGIDQRKKKFSGSSAKSHAAGAGLRGRRREG